MAGPNLQALIAYATGKLRVSRRNLRDFLAAMGLEVSLGTLQTILEGMSEALEAPTREVVAHVQASPMIHGDETGYGRNRLGRWWLWAASCLGAVAFRLAAGRGTEQLAELIPLDYGGILHRDRWRPYEHLLEADHQLCHAHLRRAFQGLIDRGGKAERVGKWLLDENTRMFSLWHGFRDGSLDRASLCGAMGPIQMRMRRCLKRIMTDPVADRKARALARDLLRQWDHLWTFVAIKGVEPTNNEAERVLRPAVLWRKGSFGVRSLAGARWVERILTVLGTASKRKIPIIDFLQRASLARLHGLDAPSLITA
jgi:transposase